MTGLAGRKALVTGASRGIGRAVALRLAGAGVEVAAVARGREALEALAAEAPEGRVHVLPADLADPAAAGGVVSRAAERLGALDFLVNNAGVTRDGFLLRLSPADWDLVMTLNLRAAFLLTQKAARLMLKARRGAIVNIVSVVGQIGNAGQANYTAAKAGLEAFTKTCARELAPRQVRVNAVAPGFIETDMTASLPEAVRGPMLERVPLARAGTAEEVAGVVAFLLSEETRYVTGQVWRVDGGMVM